MTDRIRIHMADGVADVRLTRADKMNALDDAMFDALVDAGTTLASDASVRCVVLSGEGRAFCAGIDLDRLAHRAQGGAADGGSATGRLIERSHGVANKPQYSAWVWHELPVPVIAAVHGVAFGGGFQIMLGADMRYVHPDTRLSVMEVRWGLVPDMAGTVLMRRLARDDVIRELTYTGRVFSGREALDFGFATRVCDDPLTAALQTAREIATRSPTAIEAAKRLFNADNTGAANALMAESIEQETLMGSPNQRETLAAHRDKRDPVFEPGRGLAG